MFCARSAGASIFLLYLVSYLLVHPAGTTMMVGLASAPWVPHNLFNCSLFIPFFASCAHSPLSINLTSLPPPSRLIDPRHAAAESPRLHFIFPCCLSGSASFCVSGQPSITLVRSVTSEPLVHGTASYHVPPPGYPSILSAFLGREGGPEAVLSG